MVSLQGLGSIKDLGLWAWVKFKLWSLKLSGFESTGLKIHGLGFGV